MIAVHNGHSNPEAAPYTPPPRLVYYASLQKPGYRPTHGIAWQGIGGWYFQPDYCQSARLADINEVILLGLVSLATAQQKADGSLVARACNY